MAATSAALASGNATTYRTCPRSGLQFERSAEKSDDRQCRDCRRRVAGRRHPRHWRGADPLARRPLAGEADTFYMVLTAHGIDMLIFWIIFFEVAVLYFCSSTLLRCRIATPKIAWAPSR
jgi:cytochrome c oxidase subunit 1